MGREWFGDDGDWAFPSRTLLALGFAALTAKGADLIRALCSGTEKRLSEETQPSCADLARRALFLRQAD